MKPIASIFNKLSILNRILFLGFIFSFIYLILQPPIVSFDTMSYLRAEISRFPGFVIFIRVYKLIFGEFYEPMVGMYLVFGFGAIYRTIHTLKRLFNLKLWQLLVTFAILLFPYFPPLSIANNICSEGLAYPLYLLMISFGLSVLKTADYKQVLYFGIAYLLLTLTRGQFIFIPLLFLLLFVLQHRKALFHKKTLVIAISILCLPFLNVQLDKTYRKLAYGHFVSTPYSYVNAITLPLYVSKKEDRSLFTDPNVQQVFDFSYHRIDSLNLLSRKIDGDRFERFKGFYEQFPVICNQNVHSQGIQFYYDKGYGIYESYIQIEKDCKVMMPLLIQHNFKEFITLYYTNVIHGFGSVFIALFLLLVCIWSGIKTLRNYNTYTATVFLITLLIISNALIVGIACHSIMRYIFYNYFLFFVLIVLLFQKKIVTEENP